MAPASASAHFSKATAPVLRSGERRIAQRHRQIAVADQFTDGAQIVAVVTGLPTQ